MDSREKIAGQLKSESEAGGSLMRMPVTVVLSFLAAVGVLGFDSSCTPGSTVVKVVDCGGAAVQGAHIDIKVCCANNQQVERSAVTASNGEATFDINSTQICDGKVSFAGFSTTSFGTGSCTTPDSHGNSLCTVQVCKQ
jgi:streptogramin lyase